MITQSYELNMIPHWTRPIVLVSQFDDGARTISFILKNGEDYYIPVNPVVFIGETEVPCTVSNNAVSFVVTSDITQTAGAFEGEIRDEGIGSNNFDFIVDGTPQ